MLDPTDIAIGLTLWTLLNLWMHKRNATTHRTMLQKTCDEVEFKYNKARMQYADEALDVVNNIESSLEFVTSSLKVCQFGLDIITSDPRFRQYAVDSNQESVPEKQLEHINSMLHDSKGFKDTADKSREKLHTQIKQFGDRNDELAKKYNW